MSEKQVFQLERLYFGTLAGGSDPASTSSDVIARTPNITPAHVAECLRLARLTPPTPGESSGEMLGTLALFRGESTDFILAKAQHNDARRPQVMYILMPVAPLRQLGGNMLAFRSLAVMEMPSFSAVKTNLQPFELREPTPASADEQTEILLDLLLYCGDSFKNVEGILAGLVQGWPVAIVNSPPSLDQRLRFLQGLLNLLPGPARVGITFATHLQAPQAAPVQIKFLSQQVNPDKHLVYDWANGKLLTSPPEDPYSHYIVSQFRLDPSLVVQQTDQLARTAVWRAMHKENLARALTWVSRRAAIDQTVRDGLPADRALVASVLREDPTLPDDLRQVYARHLLAFTLALDDLEPADVIPVVAATSQDAARAITEQLHAAIESGKSWTVFTLIERWLLHVPEAAGPQWHPILQVAIKQHLAELLKQDQVQPAIDFINYLKSAHPALRLDSITPELVKVAQGPARSHPELAHMLFLMAVEALPAGELHRLLSDGAFVSQLPQPLQVALAYLQPEPRHPAPPHMFDTAARAFGDGFRMLVLARLVEWAMFRERPELIDASALQALLIMAQSPQAERFQSLIQHVVDDFSQVSIIQVLEPPGPRILVQLVLQLQNFGQAIGLLEFYQNVVFRPERLEEFTRLAEEVFLMTPLLENQLTEALIALEGSQIRPEPRAVIFCSALVNRQWADEQEYAARRLTTMIFNDNNLINMIGHDNALKLLDFHARRHDALDALRVGAALVDSTVNMGNKGAVLITQMWPAITWNAEVSEAALELLRRYLRGVPLHEAPLLIGYFEQTLGRKAADTLQATYLMRQAMGESGLMRFSDDVHTATQLCVDIATTYHPNKEPPPNHRLRRDLDTMTGGLSEKERKQVAENISIITRLIYELGRERSQKRGRQADDELLIQGKSVPRTGTDLLRFIGGHFAQKEAVALDLEREAMAHIFGSRSAAMFLRETDAITHLLKGLQAAFQDKNATHVTPEALLGEIDSLWGTLSLYNQRRIQDQFAEDCQHLAEVITIMSERGSERILSNSGVGRQLETGQRQPHTALEALRWIYGYFTRKHIRTRT